MKTFKLFLLGLMLFFGVAAQAQVSVNINLGTPPLWGPVGYTEVRYYYLPDVEAYYDVQSSMFIYDLDGIWVQRTYLPVRYRNYDLYNGYKVVMHDYHGNTPYIHHKDYQKKYYKGYHGEKQRTIGQKPGKDRFKANDHQKEIKHYYNDKNQGNDSHKSNQKATKHDNGNGKKNKKK